MYQISDSYKNYIETKTSITSKSKIIVDGVEYTGKVIKTTPKISHKTEKMFGGFPAKSCNFEIYDLNGSLDFENKEIYVYRGIVINGEIEYVPQGIFIPRADKITTNISQKTISFKDIQDKTQLFDEQYFSNLDWSIKHTGLEIVQEICNRLGITLETTNFNWYNYKFNQPNFSENITYREVISRLAEIGGSIAFISRTGGLVIKSQNSTGHVIQRKRYGKPSKEKRFGIINTVVLGRDGMNNDIVYPTTINEERIEWKILDNPFVDLYREEMIEEVSKYIIGSSIIPFTLNDFVDGFYLDLNDTIDIVEKNGDTFTGVILNYENTSRIKSTIGADTQNKSLTNYNLAGSQKQVLRKVQLDVDHNNKRITALAEEVDENSSNISQLEVDTEGIKTSVEKLDSQYENTMKIKNTTEITHPIIVGDAGPYNAEEFKIYGNSEQDTTTGKNLFDYITNLRTFYNGLSSVINEDGSITTTGVPTANYTSMLGPVTITDILEDGEDYTISVKDFNTKLYLQLSINEISSGNITRLTTTSANSRTFTVDKSNYTYQINIQTNSIAIWGTENISITNFYQLEKGSTATSFEKYTGGKPNPTPDYPSKIKNIEGIENLFDKNNVNSINGYIASGTTISRSSGARTIYIKCKPNTTYTISKKVQPTASYNRFNVGTTETLPAIGTTVMDKIVNGDGTTKSIQTITTSNKANYLVCFIYGENTEMTFEDMLDTIMIVEGDNVYSYIPYGNKYLQLNITDENKTQEKTYNYPLEYELCETSDIRDEIDIISGNLTKKIGKVILDGSSDENIQLGGGAADSVDRFYITMSNLYNGATSRDKKISSNLLPHAYNYQRNVEAIDTEASRITFTFYKSRASNVATLRQFLQEQPLEIYYVYEEPLEINLEPFNIELFEGYNKITILDKYGIINEAQLTYLTDSELNSQYASKAELKITANSISQTVKTKVDKNEVISEINQSSEKISIKAEKIALEGYTTINEGFSIDEEGNVAANNGTFTGGKIELNGGSQTNPKFLVTSQYGDAIIFSDSVGGPTMLCRNSNGNVSMSNEYISFNTLIGDGIAQSMLLKGGTAPYIKLIGYGTESKTTEIKSNEITTPIVHQTSLEKNKKNFEKFENALSILDDIDLYKYNLIYEKDEDKKHIGFVIGNDFKYSKEITSNDNTSVDTYSMISLCLQAIKEQQEIINKQQKQIEELQNKIKEVVNIMKKVK